MGMTERPGGEELGRISDLLTGCGLPLHGACAFAELSHNLLPCRAAARLPDKPGTVLTLLFPYRFPDRGPRNLSRYAACLPDYHLAAGEVLSSAAAALRAAYPRYRFEPFVDNSPLPEVRAAALSGLGCIGDNGLLIHPVYGSWVFIAAIVTDMVLPLPPAGPPLGCLHCGACAAACPAGCIGREAAGRRGCRRGCLSAVSQKKGSLTPKEEALLRSSPLVWGCDRCQEVCPLNRGTQIQPHPCFTGYQGRLTAGELGDLTGKAYGWRGRGVLERNLKLQGGPD